MRRAAGQFSEDFDREIGRIYTNFQTSLPEAKNPESRTEQLRRQLSQLYSHWTESAPYPNLVSELFLIPQREPFPKTIERFNPQTKEFQSISPPPELVGLLSPSAGKRALSVSVIRLGAATGKVVQFGPHIDRTVPAIAIPLVDPAIAPLPQERAEFHEVPGNGAAAIIKLNLEYLRKEFIPALARKHLLNTDGSSAYNFAVIDQNAPERVIASDTASVDFNALGDIRVPIFGSNIFEYPRTVQSSIADLLTSDHNLRRERRNGYALQIQNTERFFAAGLDLAPSSWQLVLTHQAGSLDVAVQKARDKNLAIGFGILLLLGLCVALTLLSAQRERRLAQQQMEFVSAVSHELRTPLAVICSAGENLADGVVQDSERTRKYGTLVRNEGHRLAEMVEQVLDFAGIQSGKKLYRVEPTNLVEVINTALETFEMQIRENGVILEKRLALDLPVVVADAPALSRALQNLIGNALKYGRSGNWLSVRAESAENFVNVIIEDRGPGISPVDLPHIFEPFYRGHAVVAAQIKGSGLGLSLVKQILDAHGATIHVGRAVPYGAVFTVSIPASQVERTSVAVDGQAYSAR
jgi:signal transduction histidine kinase